MEKENKKKWQILTDTDKIQKEYNVFKELFVR